MGGMGSHRRQNLAWRCLCFTILCATGWADSVVVFNEIQYHPAVGAPEWIELYNQMAIDIDLSGWSLDGAVEYTFVEGTLIPAGSYLVVASQPELFWAQGIPTSKVLGPFKGKLDNGGETIRLINNSGRLLNRVRYGTDGDWPTAPRGTGVSLARINPMRGTDDPANWTWSDQVGGTPGTANFPGGAVRIRPLRFNEIDAAGGNQFQIEIICGHSDFVALGDYRLEIRGKTSTLRPLPQTTLQPGQFHVIVIDDLKGGPSQGDLLVLWQGDDCISDATTVTDRLRGRYPDGADTWCFEETATFGRPNVVQLCPDVVLNEIHYHPQVLPTTIAGQNIVTLVPEITTARILIPLNGPLDSGWTGGAEPFDDSTWTDAATAIGFETGTGYETYIRGDTRQPMYQRQGSVFMRIAFDVADPDRLDSLTLWMRYDDGFVAYLNGREIARANAPDVLSWNSLAAASHDDMEAVIFQEFPVSAGVGLLKPGRNILAIHGLNVALNSSDFLIQPRLDATEKTAQMEPDSRTWIELHNKGLDAVDLSGWRLSEGVSYTIPEGTVLAPNGYLVIARDIEYLKGLYPDVSMVGNFGGRLSHSGEAIVLEDAAGNPVDRVRYFDGGSWPVYADGGGCTLELIDPRSNNDNGQAWAASDESAKVGWQNFSYRGIAARSPVGDDGLYREFVLGLLDQGEILLDDLRVIEDPSGAAVDLLQNGDFSKGTQAWRILGNHRHSRIEPDPEDPGNPVLHLVATGPTEHMHNHAETTFAGGRSVQNGREYEIRFRARWIAGSPLLHTRVYFNRLSKTTILPTPQGAGTPGLRNSRWKANLGPTFSGLRHQPAVPVIRERVHVTVRAQDPDGVTSVTLWYRLDGNVWRSVLMEPANDTYTADIPPQASGSIVQFYVEAVDGLGQSSWCPPAGPGSFAQYCVADGKARTTGVHNYRLVMRNEQRNFLYDPTNLMSNDRIGATLIYNEREAYYDVGVRLKSSEHGRPKMTRVGFSVAFSPEYPFRGVHEKLAFDRSNGQEVGQQEMLLHTAMNHYGGFSKYHDLGYLIAPDDQHSSGVEVQMARYEQLYCQEMYGDAGGDGTLFEYELIYPLTATVGNDPEGLKIPQEGGGVAGLSVSDYLGEDREKYRWHFLIKNHRDQDNYAPIIRMTRALGLSGSAFEQAADQYLDVSEWLQAFAVGSTAGVSDNWVSGSSHNALFYHRPTDDKVLFFLQDLDYYNSSMPLKSNSTLRKLTQTPQWDRVFYGCVYDFLTTSFNRRYMARWAAHYATLLPEQPWGNWLNYIDNRHTNVMAQVLSSVPSQVPFEVLAVSGRTVIGRGWITVQQIRLLETGVPLEVVWQDWTMWQAQLPEGTKGGTLGAYNTRGMLVETAVIP